MLMYISASPLSLLNSVSNSKTGKAYDMCAQWCPTLCDPKDWSLPGSSVPGISQARIQEWVSISPSRDWTCIFCIVNRSLYNWAILDEIRLQWCHLCFFLTLPCFFASGILPPGLDCFKWPSFWCPRSIFSFKFFVVKRHRHLETILCVTKAHIRTEMCSSITYQKANIQV